VPALGFTVDKHQRYAVEPGCGRHGRSIPNIVWFVEPLAVGSGLVADKSAPPGAEPRALADSSLAGSSLPADTVGLLEGLTSMRAIRLYRDEPVPDHVLRAAFFAASRAPSGSNRQPFRFVVLTDGERARAAKGLIGASARRFWQAKRSHDGYDTGTGAERQSPKARLARSMQHYVDHFEEVPVLALACLLRTGDRLEVTDGGSVYPACQNLLLAARALGYGGVMTGWHRGVEADLKALLGIPDEAVVAATITLGRPRGSHGPVRRNPLAASVYAESWGDSPTWAVDPAGTGFVNSGAVGSARWVPVERQMAASPDRAQRAAGPARDNQSSFD
jgi:nitroreductase